MPPTSATSRTGSSEESIETILVVEDEVLIRFPLAEHLRDCGYRVVEAASVAEAKALLSADAPVDLVFSDVNMPGAENGLTLARWIRRHHPATPVLLTSGHANLAETAGDLCDGSPLAKPYEHEAVLARIQALLGDARRARPAGP